MNSTIISTALRFALAIVLLIGLMLTNAVVHLYEHPKRVQVYHDGVAEYQNHLTASADESLYRLAQRDLAIFTKSRRPSASAQKVVKLIYRRERQEPHSLDHQDLGKFLDTRISASEYQFRKFTSRRYLGGLEFYHRLRFESDRIAVLPLIQSLVNVNVAPCD